MTAVDTAKLGQDWQYYVTAAGLLRRGYWEQQLPASSMPALREALSSFATWKCFFGLEAVEACDGRRSAEARSSSKGRKQRASTSKPRGSEAASAKQENEGRASKVASAARRDCEGGASPSSGAEEVPPASELTEFLESDESLAQERKELLGEEGMLSMRVRVLLFDVLMQNALHLDEPSIVLAKRSAMSIVGPHKGNASAGSGATGIVYNEMPAPGEEGEPGGDHLMLEADKPDFEGERRQQEQREQRERAAKLAALAQAPALDFSSEEKLAATAEPILRYGLREFYRLEDMFYTLEYDAEDLAFEQERHQGIPRGVLPGVPLPKPDHHRAAAAAQEEAEDGAASVHGDSSGQEAGVGGSQAGDASAAGAAGGRVTPSAAATPQPQLTASSGATPVTDVRESPAVPKSAPSSSRFLASNLGESMEDVPTGRDSLSSERSPDSNEGSPTGGSSARELRNLLSDVKPYKAWNGSAMDAQEELCASLEDVMLGLKGYTKHSYPFLTRVRKCDAPDYYEIIKEPIDLGKMHKKLKRLEYYSKQEFIDDLDLMLDNCRRYNTDPKSIYRVHAKMLDKKAKILLKKVPDIDISSDRSALEEASKARRSRPPRSQVPGSAPVGASRGRGRPRKHSLEPRTDDESPSPLMTPISAVKRGRPGRPRKYPADDSPGRSESPATAKRKRGRPGRPRKIRPEDFYHEPEFMLAQMLQFTEPDDLTTEELAKEYFATLDAAQRLDWTKEDPQIRLWRVRTLAARLRAAREREICQDLPFSEHRELQRTPKDMFQFVCNYAAHCDELYVDGASGQYDDEQYCDLDSYDGTEEAEFMEKRPTFSTSNLPQVIDITIESTKKKRGRGRISNIERQKIQEEEEIKRAMAMRAPMDKSTCENYFMPEALPLCAVPDMPQPLPPVPPKAAPYAFSTTLECNMAANLPTLRAIHRLRELPETQDADGDISMAGASVGCGAPVTAASASASTFVASSSASASAVARDGPAGVESGVGHCHDDVTPSAFSERSFLSHSNAEASRVMLTKAVAVATEHAGFQAAESSALEVLTDGCMRFMERFANILQAHQVAFCNKAKPAALLTRCLYEMGVDGVAGLRMHMEEDVELRGARLQQMLQLAAQHSKLPATEVARLSCSTKVTTPPGKASGLGSGPPALAVQPVITKGLQAPTPPFALLRMMAASRTSSELRSPAEDSKIIEGDENDGDGDEDEDEDEVGVEDEDGEGRDEDEDANKDEDVDMEESNGDADEQEAEEEEGEDEGEEDDGEEGEEEGPRRKFTRSSRSSTLGKRTKPEPRTTRATRSRQEPSPKTAKTRNGAVSPPQRRRSRSQRNRNG